MNKNEKDMITQNIITAIEFLKDLKTKNYNYIEIDESVYQEEDKIYIDVYAYDKNTDETDRIEFCPLMYINSDVVNELAKLIGIEIQGVYL